MFTSIMMLARPYSTTLAFASTTIEKSLQYRIRQATIEDIPSIQACNKKTLPENYDYQYLYRHLTTFPDLAFVAENDDKHVQTKNHRQLLGYALGKLEYPANRDDFDRNHMNIEPPFEGHVTSLAVYDEYRGHGIAKKLLDSLHDHFGHNKVDVITLKCRVSNTAALKLYTECYPYQCSYLLPAYYQDDEDAWHLTLSGLQQIVKSNKVNINRSNQRN